MEVQEKEKRGANREDEEMNSQCDKVERILWKSRRKKREAQTGRTKRCWDVEEVPPVRQTGKDTQEL